MAFDLYNFVPVLSHATINPLSLSETCPGIFYFQMHKMRLSPESEDQSIITKAQA
jgi:hypothetical protein